VPVENWRAALITKKGNSDTYSPHWL